MNTIERAKGFVEFVLGLGARDWRQCPSCGRRATRKNVSYLRRPWDDDGCKERRLRRYWCHGCCNGYSEQSPDLVPRSWYTRVVQRKALDLHQHAGCSLRKAVEWLRAEMGKQGRNLERHTMARLRLDGACCRLCARTLLRWLARADSDIEQTYSLAQTFSQLVRERKSEELDSWVESAKATGIPELRSFAAGLVRDKAAVLAALSLPWSNGQVEGQVHRLKLIKRQMYGRAHFDLLRQRVLNPG
jgi:hypothetical protein